MTVIAYLLCATNLTTLEHCLYVHNMRHSATLNTTSVISGKLVYRIHHARFISWLGSKRVLVGYVLNNNCILCHVKTLYMA